MIWHKIHCLSIGDIWFKFKNSCMTWVYVDFNFESAFSFRSSEYRRLNAIPLNLPRLAIAEVSLCTARHYYVWHFLCDLSSLLDFSVSFIISSINQKFEICCSKFVNVHVEGFEWSCVEFSPATIQLSFVFCRFANVAGGICEVSTIFH